LFDNSVIEKQRAEIESLRQEAEQLRLETEVLRQQGTQQVQKNTACNRAFNDFDAARKAADDTDAAAYYKAGLGICPDDDVAHYELGEIYVRLDQTDAAIAEFKEVVRINPKFSRAQRQLERLQETGAAPSQ
jgi:tetratricopeptide (TPR) repeat protein